MRALCSINYDTRFSYLIYLAAMKLLSAYSLDHKLLKAATADGILARTL